jgi:magnesium-dependent phosphatase 1
MATPVNHTAPVRIPLAPRLPLYVLSDNTLWTPELYQLRRAPKADRDIWLFEGAKAALHELASSRPEWSDTRVALASRTGQVEWAYSLLKRFDAAPGVTMDELTSGLQQIFPGSKRKHFERLKADSRVPFSEMLFFDDSTMNTRDIEQMGVLCVLCPRGLTTSIWQRGLLEFAHMKEEVSPSGLGFGVSGVVLQFTRASCCGLTSSLRVSFIIRALTSVDLRARPTRTHRTREWISWAPQYHRAEDKLRRGPLMPVCSFAPCM